MHQQQKSPLQQASALQGLCNHLCSVHRLGLPHRALKTNESAEAFRHSQAEHSRRASQLACIRTATHSMPKSSSLPARVSASSSRGHVYNRLHISTEPACASDYITLRSEGVKLALARCRCSIFEGYGGAVLSLSLFHPPARVQLVSAMSSVQT